MKKVSQESKKSNNNQVKGSEVKLRGLLSSILLLGCIFILPGNSLAARERYAVDLDDMHLIGGINKPATIYLKQAFKRQYPRVDMSRLKVKKVVLVAKSKHGYGKAQLRVGRQYIAHRQVQGHPLSFNAFNKNTFDRVWFQNIEYSGQGPWQLRLHGNFIVRKVILEVEENRPRRHRLQPSLNPVHQPGPLHHRNLPYYHW